MAGGRPLSDRRDWAGVLVAALAAWLISGVYLVVRATGQGLVEDVAVSVWHLPAYAALVVALLVVVLAAARSVRLHGSAGAFLPPGYGVLPIGVGLLALYVIADPLWRGSLGIGDGIEGAIAPTRLLLAGGLVLAAAGPLRAAWLARREARPVQRPAVYGAAVSAGLIGAGIAFALLPVHPVFSPWLRAPENVREDDSEIWRMGADGSAQTRIVQAGDGVEYSLPVASPDGKRLAVTRWTLGSAGRLEAHIWTMAADGSDQRAITSGSDWSWIPAWSPAGDWIAYTVTPQGPAAPSGPAAPQPGRAPELAGVTSSTDADIWLVRPDGSQAHAIVSDPADDLAPAWSPDGRRLAFVSTRDGNQEIYLAAADGSGATRLTSDPADDWAPAWTPDGSTVVYTSARTGAHRIWSQAVGGGPAVQRSDGPGQDDVAAVSPDGRTVAFTSDRTGDAEVWVMPVGGGTATNVSRSASSNDGQWSVSWTPDGRQLLYASAGQPPASSSPLVRRELAVAGSLVHALVVAVLAPIAVGIVAVPGAITLLLGIGAGLAALAGEAWSFVPGAILTGLLVDLALRRIRARRLPAAGALAAAGFVASPGVTLALSGDLGWPVTLLLGTVGAAAIAGWLAGSLVAMALATSQGAVGGRGGVAVEGG